MSDSSPDLLSHRKREDRGSLSRSASYQNLPEADVTGPVSPPLRRTFSDLTSPNQTPSPTKEDVAAGKDILRRTSIRSKNKDLAVAVSRVTESAEKLDEDNVSPNSEAPDVLLKIPETKPPEPVARPSKARAMSGRLVSLARKPWGSSLPSSRPESPSASNSPKPRALRIEDVPCQPPPPQPVFNSKEDTLQSDPGIETDAMLPPRKRTMLNKRPRRPMVAVVTHGHRDSVDSPNSPSTNSLRANNSFEKFSAALNVSTPVLPPMSKSAAASTTALAGTIDPPRKKDELWGVFRGLEADFQK